MPRIAPSSDWMEYDRPQSPQHDEGIFGPLLIPTTDDEVVHQTHANDAREAGPSIPAPLRYSFNSSGHGSTPHHNTAQSQSYFATSLESEGVRESTLQLSSMVFPSKLHPNGTRRQSSGALSSFCVPSSYLNLGSPIEESVGEEEIEDRDQDPMRKTMPSTPQQARSFEPVAFPRQSPPSAQSYSPSSPQSRERAPSALTRLIAEAHANQSNPITPQSLPTPHQLESQSRSPIPPKLPPLRRPVIVQSSASLSDENAPLLQQASNQSSYDAVTTPAPDYFTTSSPVPPPTFASHLKSIKKLGSKEAWKQTTGSLISSIPAVIIGMLLNILDGVSYGIILFPAHEIFGGFGSLGVSMFFVTTVIAQLVYSFGASEFIAVNGSMMIEVVPFFAILVQGIIAEVGEENPKEVIATTMVAFALSSVLTGFAFLLLGLLKLGALIGFFPRHILIGCIGGIGWFLLETGFEVSAGLNEKGFEYSIPFFRMLFMDAGMLQLWLPALGLAVLLKVVMLRFKHQLIFPMYFLAIPVVFYIIVAIGGFKISTLRSDGWVFDIGQSESWWKFYTYFNFRLTNWNALWVTMPTQLALLFFNVLHPPLNVPALSITLDQEVNLNKELVAHGYSNLLAGLLGTVPNYEVYINSVIFYRVGGNKRISGFLLAAATFGLLLIGTAPIGFIPIMLVGSLIFVLGIDLVKEAVWDTRNRVSRAEYVTIIAIMVCMSVYDFVIGVLLGIMVSCVFFVFQSSQSQSIRALYTGDNAMSSVRRPSAHRAYLQEVAKQTTIMRLQGFLFFGTCTYMEDAIRKLIEPAAWKKNPIRFVVMDLSLVPGVDVSSAEALIRIQRLLAGKQALLVLCGFKVDSPVGRSLAMVKLAQKDNVEIFESFSEGLEWTENAYLRAYFMSLKTESDSYEVPIKTPVRDKAPFTLGESYATSPRRSHIHQAAHQASLPVTPLVSDSSTELEPTFTLMKAFSSYGTVDKDMMSPLAPYLTRLSVPKGVTLWKKGDTPDSLYVIESGVLTASYEFTAHSDVVVESMVSGTLAGELSFLSGTPRNATVAVERQAVIWKLSCEGLEQLERDNPQFAKLFIRLVIRAANIEHDVLMASLAARQ